MGFETGLSFILYPWTHYTIIMVLLVKNEKVFMVYIAIFIGMLASSIFFVDSRTVVSFKRNLDQVMKEWNCKDPHGRREIGEGKRAENLQCSSESVQTIYGDP